AENYSLPGTRVLLSNPSTLMWGYNCVAYGVNCQHMAVHTLGAEIVPLDAAAKNGMALDLVGVFNSLDHMDFPVETLRKALTVARFVVVVTHTSAQAGKQHLFALTQD